MKNMKHSVSVSPGKNLLKVTSIIGLVFCGITFFSTLVGGLGMYSKMGESIIVPQLGEASHYLPPPQYWLFFLALCCYKGYMYVMGIRHCTELEKAGLLKMLGVISIVLTFIDAIVQAYIAPTPMRLLNAFAFLPIYLILPVIYTMGATKNQKAFTMQTSLASFGADAENKTVSVRPSNPLRTYTQPKQMLRVECPNCGNKFPMAPNASTIICPNCRVELEIG